MGIPGLIKVLSHFVEKPYVSVRLAPRPANRYRESRIDGVP